MRPLISIVIILSLAVPIFSQGPVRTKPSFEVATIKRNTSIQGGSRQGGLPGGRFVATRVTLRSLIGFAYTGKSLQFLNGPSWIDSDLWDVEAKAPEGSVPPRTGPPDMNVPDAMALMVQSLLEDRFQLKTHNETREVPVYELTVAKGGPKLKLSEDQSAPALPQAGGPAPQRSSIPRGAMMMVRGDYEGSALSLDYLAKGLSLFAGRKVIDKTGLKGLYDFKLLWTPDAVSDGPVQPGGPVAPAPASADPAGPSIFSA